MYSEFKFAKHFDSVFIFTMTRIIILIIREFEFGAFRKPEIFNTSEAGPYIRIWENDGKCRDRVEVEGLKFEQEGITPIVQAEVGDGRVHITGKWEYGGFVAGHVHPLKISGVLNIKQSFR